MAKLSEEQALVERFGRGDDAAFDRIVERHSAEIAALAGRRTWTISLMKTVTYL